MIKKWKLNTSNQGKFAEFQRILAQYHYGLEATHIDLPEIDADPISVVAHKASQLEEGVLVDDTSLEIEGASVGIHVRWLIDHLSFYLGKKAQCRVLLAYRTKDEIAIFEGKVSGRIVAPKGKDGFGFDFFFIPDGEKLTLAESKPDRVNARALAVKALLANNPLTHHPLIESWEGKWQL